MKFEIEDMTKKINETEEKFLTANISELYDRFNDRRSSQLTDIKLVRDAVYNSEIPRQNGWDSKLNCRIFMNWPKL